LQTQLEQYFSHAVIPFKTEKCFDTTIVTRPHLIQFAQTVTRPQAGIIKTNTKTFKQQYFY
jgi:hypothetical protein